MLKSFSFIIFLACIADNLIFLGADKASPFVEYKFFCARLTAVNGSYEITDAKLNWGKWTPSPSDHSTEVRSPKGKKFAYNAVKFVYVCAAGRSFTPSGTDGWITVKARSTSSEILLLWNYPYLDDDSHGIKYDAKEYKIQETRVDSNYYEFDITLRRWSTDKLEE